MRKLALCPLALLLAGLVPRFAGADVAGPGKGSLTTTLTAHVREQVRVTVPAGVGFDVSNTRVETRSTAASVTLDNIVVSSGAHQVRLLVRASAPQFTPPVPGAATWHAAGVSWAAVPWANATGHAGTLSSDEYAPVATGAAGAAALSTTSLVFALRGKPSVRQSGDHTLVITWKVESMGAGEL